MCIRDRFAADCAAKGVSALVIQHDIDLSAMPGVTVVKVESSRYAMAPVSYTHLLVCSGSHWLHSAVHWLRRAEHPAGTALLGGGRHGAAAGPVLPLEGQAAVCGGTAAPLAGKARHECSDCLLYTSRCV